MKGFEYEITRHPAEDFNRLVYFCTAEGDCNIDQVPGQETQVLKDILNSMGNQGWELAQISFGKEGLIAFWKRPK